MLATATAIRTDRQHPQPPASSGHPSQQSTEPLVALPTPEPLISLQQAVELGYGGYSTLRAYIADGRLEAVKVGRRYRLRRNDLEALQIPAPGRPPERTAADAAIDRIVAAAPRLTAEQRERLALILGGDTQ